MPQAASPDLASSLYAALTAGKPANIALMWLVMQASERAEVEQAIHTALARDAALAGGHEADRLRQVLRLWSTNPDAWRVVRSVADIVRHHGAGAPHSIAQWAGVFDAAAAMAPDAGVALYSFGNPALLEAATAEIVEWLRSLHLLSPSARVLDIGCGNGRLLKALAPSVALVAGVDISAAMLRVAQERCRGLANVRFAQTAGGGLGHWEGDAFDLALAVDVFPYIVPLGCELVRNYVADAGQALKSGGALALLNFSYRGDLEKDRSELALLASELGFAIACNGISPFKLWDGTAFLLVKQKAEPSSSI